MRNSTFPLVASLLLSLLALSVSAQKISPQQNAAATHKVRCGTMEALELYFQQNPAAREQYLRNVEEGKRMVANVQSTKQTAPAETHKPDAIVTIPVVFHFVLNAADQAKVTKADVIWQLNKMNEDYSGLNPDSTNGSGFYGIRGHSQIRFCLAQQDPNGDPTDGIDRVYSTITDFSPSTVGTIKHATSCGADAWDPNRYLNVWVSYSTSLLGIATFPQTGPANEQGVAIALDGFSNNPAYVNPFFALGRTLVHESGHYFGLYHSWGDDTDCSGDDFRQVAGTCLLPASLLLGDTPNQAGSTSGCPSGVRTDICSNTAPGINYQNYMDYTDDACYSMFTKQQVARAEYILNNCRSSLLTSNGCVAPVVFTNDAGTRLMSPGNSCFPGGSSSTTFCQNTTFSAQIMLRNFGTANLTSAKLNAVVGNGTVVTTNWTGNLAPYASVIVTIPNINAGTASGAQTLKVYTTDPNNVADQRVTNDTATISITVTAAGTGVASVTEGFESATFPPAGWNVINPNAGSMTWARTTAARNSGNASAWMNLYNYSGSLDHLDYLVSPAVNVSGVDSIVIDFARAYKRYGTSAGSADTLMIQLSTQCGATSFPITAWKKGGDDLSTSPGSTLSNWTPAASEWGRELVDVRSFVPTSATSVIVSFTSRNRYGENMYLDDINIRTVTLVRRDAALSAILSPVSKLCSGTITPSVRITNSGKDPLTSAKILYRIIGPSFNQLDSVPYANQAGLPQGQSAVVPLKSVTLPSPGNYTIQAWTKEPNAGTDQNTSNDTSAVFSFRYVATVPLPLAEGFESATFPPVNWGRVNQDNQGTWFRTTAAARQGTASAVVDNYNYNAQGTNDDLETPILSYSGIDSAFLTFQVAHASYMYPGSTGIALDTFQVLVTRDCGQTFTTVYSKWGEDLQTVNDPNSPYTDLFVPTSPTQWRKETVNLSQVLGASGSAQLIFRSKGNFGNTLLLDDINITTKTLPAKLKQQGYMIAPNPFSGSFSIQHYLLPTSLRGIQVTNAAGQLVYAKNFNGNASSNITIDLSRYAAGMYGVKLIYDNKVITERVIKRN